jgi:hypothetical protein
MAPADGFAGDQEGTSSSPPPADSFAGDQEGMSSSLPLERVLVGGAGDAVEAGDAGSSQEGTSPCLAVQAASPDVVGERVDRQLQRRGGGPQQRMFAAQPEELRAAAGSKNRT